MKHIDWKAIAATIATAFLYGYGAAAFTRLGYLTASDLENPAAWIGFFRTGLAAGIAAAAGMVTRNYFTGTQTTKVDVIQLQPNTMISSTTTTTKEIK